MRSSEFQGKSIFVYRFLFIITSLILVLLSVLCIANFKNQRYFSISFNF